MDEVQYWLDWYWNYRIYTYPYTEESKMDDCCMFWSKWKNIGDYDYETMLRNFDTQNAIGIKAVTGKKGLCGIAIRRDEDWEHSQKIIRKANVLLGLPYNYRWVIYNIWESIILVDVKEGFTNHDPKRFEHIRILWEVPIKVKTFFEDDPYKVSFVRDINPLLMKRPIQISKKDIYRCIEDLSYESIILTENAKWNSMISKIKRFFGKKK